MIFSDTFRYQCAKCSQARLVTTHYNQASLNDNSRVKPTQLPGFNTIPSCGYHMNSDASDSSVKEDLKCDKDIKSTITGSTAKGSPVSELVKSLRKLSIPQNNDDCVTCDNSFSNHAGEKSSSFRNKHRGENRLSCNTCGKQFHFDSELAMHKVIPTDKKPFPCSICTKSFRSHGNRSEHIRRIHELVKNYFCVVCGKTFFRKFELSSHIENNHLQPSELTAQLMNMITLLGKM